MRSAILAMVALLPVLAWAQTGATPAVVPGVETTRPALRTSSRPPRTAQPSTPAATRPARPPSPAQAAQQQRMRDCNAEARSRGVTGAARSAFMRPCLGGNMPNSGGGT